MKKQHENFKTAHFALNSGQGNFKYRTVNLESGQNDGIKYQGKQDRICPGPLQKWN